MRYSLVILLFSLTLSSSGSTYYVATNGNDGNPGTITQPWATWQYGFNHISPGDILYIRGGTYTPTVITSTSSRHCAVIVNGKKGTSSSPYQVFAYPGETPILDCRNITGTSYARVGILILDSSYWHLKGLTVTRVDQPSSGATVGEGILVWGISSATHNTIESCVAHHNGGPGMGTRQYVNEINFINCDAYSNFDAYSNSPGGNADGWDIGYTYKDGIVRLTGCRAWWNGDDGFDMYQGSGYSGIYYLTNCWAWHHGYGPSEKSVGDGSGFKLGTSTSLQSDAVTRRFLYNCIAYDNRTWGFTQNTGNSKSVVYNCIAYDNGFRGFDFHWQNQYDTFRNCVSYANGSSDVFLSNQTRDHNSWDSGVTVSNADFLSIDGIELTSSRNADGSLPDINFLHLATGSDLIDAGTDIGTTYSGNAPDLGPFEKQTGAPTAPPVYSSSAIENATPSLLEMNYNLTLTNVVPAASDFNVLVNSSSRSVSSVVVSGKKVQLTLAGPVVFGDVVTISYTKPTLNPLQTFYGAEAASISAQAVTNKVNAIIPAYLSSAIANATPDLVEMTYNMTLSNIVPAASAFKVLVNSTSRSVSSVAVSGTKVRLTLSTPVVYGNTVTVSYTKPSSNPLQITSGGQAATIGAQKVTNNVSAPIIPAYFSSAIANATPAVLEMTFDMTLASIVPAASAFKVLVNSTSRSVSSVAVSRTKVLLTLSTPVVYGNTVTVSYTKPSSNPLQSTAGGQVATISAQKVTNNVNATVNSPPAVVITSPKSNSSFTEPATITISADASDADGTIKLVEFYNGTTGIGSASSSPYSFIWNDVMQGTHSITVVATDDKGAKTTSSALSVTVAAPISSEGNLLPEVNIENPTKGKRFENPADIEIQVIASDPDGTISKVELFNGAEKLVEMTTAPFNYVWKGLITGTYKITAIATDNSMATALSSIVEFKVTEKTIYDAKSEIINLYPNPNDGHFTVDFLVPLENPKNEIDISDLVGNQIYRETISAEQTTKQFDLPNVRSGIYIMRVISNEILVTKKILIK